MRFFPLAAVKIAVCRKYPRYQLNTGVTVLSKQTVMEVVVPHSKAEKPHVHQQCTKSLNNYPEIRARRAAGHSLIKYKV